MPTADIEGCTLSYRLDGPEGAPVLVLAHALGVSGAMWEPQLAAFTQQHRVLRYDHRGHGSSAVPPGPYTIERLGRDALLLLDALGLDRAAFCGLSLGSAVGMWLAANAPQRVERLVVANGTPHAGNPELWEQRIATVRAEGMAPLIEGTLGRWFTAGFRERQPAKVERIRGLLAACPPEGYAGAAAAIRDADLRPDLAAIACPTLVIGATHDQGASPAATAALAAAITGAVPCVLDAGHLSNVEQPAAFTAAVLEFLSREGPRSRRD